MELECGDEVEPVGDSASIETERVEVFDVIGIRRLRILRVTGNSVVEIMKVRFLKIYNTSRD